MAGSPAGLKRTSESMLPSLLKSSKPLYLYDEENKELIYISESQAKMCKSLGITDKNIGKYIKESSLYLARFIFFFIHSFR